MKKILLVFGTRPEAIKMAPLVRELKMENKELSIDQENSNAQFDVRVCVTAQHREMLDQVLELFEIVPDYDLDIMKSGQDLYDITSNVMMGMRGVLSDFRPDIVLVHGDTTTTFATSLAAFYQQIRVGHVEAGLRTNDLYSPWPEEANRQLTGVIANYHFAPTQTAKENLLIENKPQSHIIVTGNTVIDALFLALDKIKSNKDLETKIINELKAKISNSPFSILHSQFILVTGHRRENHGEGFINICKALKQIALSNPDTHIVYPVHLNPNVQKPVKELLSDIDNIHLIDPLQYEEFIYLMDKSYMIITDSGGIQEEAPSLGKPVLVMRDTTERPEAVSSGTVKLVGTDTNTIVQETQKLLDNKSYFDMMSKSNNPYGDGKASQKIVDFLREVSREK